VGSPDRALAELVQRALEEDSAGNDVTTAMTVGSGTGRASIVARSAGVVSGHRAARMVYGLLDRRVEYADATPDGASFLPGDVVAEVEGPICAILTGERTALNFLQHLSGVATLTSRFVALVEGTGIRILDTRKTTPGLRDLEKEAVVHGGGLNHRRDLSELVLVKENHVAAAGGLDAVIERLGEAIGRAEIEVTSIEELRKLEGTPPWRIMLDNFDPEMVTAALEELGGWQKRPPVEVSGGITLSSIGAYAVSGIDFISIGSLTSSAPSVDMSLEVARAV
jgi:nicotinate-nucleotide pyrophosphorylase (carboxylating)